MKWAAAALLLLSAGCASGHQPRWYSEPVTASSVDSLPGKDSEIVLRDGSKILLANPAEYGDALCDRYACVRKADITRIRIADHNSNGNDSIALAVIFAPVTAATMLVATAKVAHDARGGNGSAGAPTMPAQPILTPPATDPELQALRQREQQTSGSLQAEEDRLFGFLRERCQTFLPTDITALDPALAWLHANRITIPDGYCLDLAAAHTGRRKLAGHLDRELQLHVLGTVRLGWQRVQCAGAREINRIVPLSKLNGASMSQLAVISQALADEASYVLPNNYATQCENGLASPSTIPDTRTFAAAVDPFSRPAAAPWLRDRRSDEFY